MVRWSALLPCSAGFGSDQGHLQGVLHALPVFAQLSSGDSFSLPHPQKQADVRLEYRLHQFEWQHLYSCGISWRSIDNWCSLELSLHPTYRTRLASTWNGSPPPLKSLYHWPTLITSPKAEQLHENQQVTEGVLRTCDKEPSSMSWPRHLRHNIWMTPWINHSPNKRIYSKTSAAWLKHLSFHLDKPNKSTLYTSGL